MTHYFCQDIKFTFTGRRFNNLWLKKVALSEGKVLGDINVIFCSDEYLLGVNRKYLHHDYYTDIITFDYCEGDVLSGDLFISVDSVRNNSVYFKTSFDQELHRVIVHGLLHLIGYDDHTPDEQKTMRSKEDFYLKLREDMLKDGRV